MFYPVYVDNQRFGFYHHNGYFVKNIFAIVMVSSTVASMFRPSIHGDIHSDPGCISALTLPPSASTGSPNAMRARSMTVSSNQELYKIDIIMYYFDILSISITF